MPKHDCTDDAGAASIDAMTPDGVADDLIASHRAERMNIINQLDLLAALAREPSTTGMVEPELRKLAEQLRRLK